MTPEERMKELASQIYQIKIIENGLHKKLRYVLARSMVLEECLRDILRYANNGIKERHGDEESIAKDLKNMMFQAQRKIDELRSNYDA